MVLTIAAENVRHASPPRRPSGPGGDRAGARDAGRGDEALVALLPAAGWSSRRGRGADRVLASPAAARSPARRWASTAACHLSTVDFGASARLTTASPRGAARRDRCTAAAHQRLTAVHVEAWPVTHSPPRRRGRGSPARCPPRAHPPSGTWRRTPRARRAWRRAGRSGSCPPARARSRSPSPVRCELERATCVSATTPAWTRSRASARRSARSRSWRRC